MLVWLPAYLAVTSIPYQENHDSQLHHLGAISTEVRSPAALFHVPNSAQKSPVCTYSCMKMTTLGITSPDQVWKKAVWLSL